MEEHARAMEELENNTKPNQISLEIKEKVRSPALGPSQPMSEPTTFLDIIQQTPPSFSTLRAELKPNPIFSSESVKTNSLQMEKSPAKIPAPIVLVTKEEEVLMQSEDDLEEEVAKVQKSLEKVTLAKKVVEEEVEGEEEEEADGEEADVLTKSEEEEEADDGVDEEEADEEAEEEEEEEAEENYEMTQIKKVRYWHETNSHKLYKYISEDEVGEVVGKWHNIGGIVTISPV
jgi:hypothetical protein